MTPPGQVAEMWHDTDHSSPGVLVSTQCYSLLRERGPGAHSLRWLLLLAKGTQGFRMDLLTLYPTLELRCLVVWVRGEGMWVSGR